MNTSYILGSRVQAHVTAAGLIMLALRGPELLDHWLGGHDLKAYTSYSIASKDQSRIELSRVRSQGWALSEQQLELNYRGVAVPLRDQLGEMLGALSVTMPMGQQSGEDAAAWVLSVLNETAQAMRHLI